MKVSLFRRRYINFTVLRIFVICVLKVNYVVKGGSIYEPKESIKGSHAVAARYVLNNPLKIFCRV